MIGMFIFFLAILSFVKSATSSEALLKVRSTTTNSTLLPYKEWYGKRIMFIHAHTDDMECASGGLITLLKDIAEVFVVIVTNGDKGCGNDDICGNVTNSELVAIRQTEQLNSAKVLGIPAENVVFMPYEDCQLNSYPEQTVLKDIVTIVRKFQPHIVFTWDPSPKFELLASEGWGDHLNHQTSGKRALDAVSLLSALSCLYDIYCIFYTYMCVFMHYRCGAQSWNACGLRRVLRGR